MSVFMRVNAKSLLDGVMKKRVKKTKMPNFKPMKVPVFSVKGATRTKKGF